MRNGRIGLTAALFLVASVTVVANSELAGGELPSDASVSEPGHSEPPAAPSVAPPPAEGAGETKSTAQPASGGAGETKSTAQPASGGAGETESAALPSGAGAPGQENAPATASSPQSPAAPGGESGGAPAAMPEGAAAPTQPASAGPDGTTKPPAAETAPPGMAPTGDGKAETPANAVSSTAGGGAGVGDTKAGQAKAAMCGGCHGMDGNSMMPTFPKLANQRIGYIMKQLNDFKGGARFNPMMAPVAMGLSPEDIADLAAYFSSQTVSAGTPDAALVARGEDLYRRGNPKTRLVACIACHGAEGEGLAAGLPGGAPSVRGQHADYLTSQLNSFKSGERKNDFKSVMQGIAGHLNEHDIPPLVAYMASLQK